MINGYKNNYILTVDQLARLSDEALSIIAIMAKGRMPMPKFINDVDNLTQRFVYAAHLNSKPIVLSQHQFMQFLLDNKISNNHIMARSVRDNKKASMSAQEIIDAFKYSDINYIGGKIGGSVMGNGAYFRMNGGHETIYENINRFRWKENFVLLPDNKCGLQTYRIRNGEKHKNEIIGIRDYQPGKTMIAVYNPSTAKVIEYRTLIQKAKVFEKSHPLFVKEVGHLDLPNSFPNNASLYALAMGYNAIADNNPKTPTYSDQCVIDRSAVVVQKEDGDFDYDSKQ